MDAEEFRREFGFVSSDRLNVAKLIRNLIWQAYTRIRDGWREKIDSNIRGFWYTDVKSVLSRLGRNTHGRRYTERVYDYLLEMVTEHKLFNYADFGFVDETDGCPRSTKGGSLWTVQLNAKCYWCLRADEENIISLIMRAECFRLPSFVSGTSFRCSMLVLLDTQIQPN